MSEIRYRIAITIVIALVLGGLYYITERNDQPQQRSSQKHKPYGNMGGIEFGK
jgi:hypothetical protein